MKEREEKAIGQNAKDDATLNFVSLQAQEAILNPNLPEIYKDQIVGAAVGTILRIGERKNAYEVKPSRKKWGLKREHTVYEAK
jgi:hypothetical protein